MAPDSGTNAREGMRLTQEERAWLEKLCAALAIQFPDQDPEVIVFGSKARGDFGPDSDLDVLIVLGEADRGVKNAVRRLGYKLARGPHVLPSILVYTREEWAEREAHGSPFYRAVMRDGVRVA